MHLDLKTLVISTILAVLISPAAHAAGLLPFDAVRFEEAR
jgi:hypothetical protein